MRVLLYILVALSIKPALAVELQPLGKPPEERLKIDKDQANIPCDQIQARLMKYSQMSATHNSSVTGFLTQLTEKLVEWHGELSPMEGTANPVPQGQFDVLTDASNKISEITNYAFDNTDLLANELDRIIVSLRDNQCIK